MKNVRRGLGKGLGTGYKNLAPMDSHIHSLSAKGVRTKNDVAVLLQTKSLQGDVGHNLNYIPKGKFNKLKKAGLTEYSDGVNLDKVDLSAKGLSGSKYNPLKKMIEKEFDGKIVSIEKSIKDDEGQDFTFKMKFSDGETETLTISVENDGKVHWDDFSHSTSLGTVNKPNNKELVKKIKEIAIKQDFHKKYTIVKDKYDRPIGVRAKKSLNAKGNLPPELLNNRQLVIEFNKLTDLGEKGKLKNSQMEDYYKLSNELTARRLYKKTKSYKEFLKKKAEKVRTQQSGDDRSNYSFENDLFAKGIPNGFLPKELSSSKLVFKYNFDNVSTRDVLNILGDKMDLQEHKDYDIAYNQNNHKEAVIFLHSDKAVARVVQSNAFGKKEISRTTYQDLKKNKVRIMGV